MTTTQPRQELYEFMYSFLEDKIGKEGSDSFCKQVLDQIEVTHSRKCPNCDAVFANTRKTCPNCCQDVIDISFTYTDLEDLSAVVAVSMERMTERIARGKGASWTKDLALCVARNDILIRRLHAAHPTLAIMGKHE